MSEVLEYLASKGLSYKTAGGNNVHLPCFFCGEDPNKRGRLYVNVDPGMEIPGLFMCHLCGTKGALPTIQKHFGDYQVTDRGEDSLVRREILAAAAKYYHDRLADFPDAYAWLRGPQRLLTLETIVDAQLGYADGGLYVHLRENGFKPSDILKTGLAVERSQGPPVDALRGMVTIPYVVAGNVVMIRGRAFPDVPGAPKYKTCGGNATRLYNSDAAWGTDELVVTEGEFDCLVLRQLGVRSVVACPGASAWQDSWDGYVEGLRRLWVAFDNDPAGTVGSGKLLGRFGAKVRLINLPGPAGTDVTSWAGAGGSLEAFEELKAKTKGKGLLVSVAQAREEHAEMQGARGLSLGIPLLDLVVQPGLLPSQVMVVLAKSGVGKTLFLLNLMQRMTMVPGQEDLKFLLLSLEQTRGEWFERARRIWRFYNLDSDDDACDRFWGERLMLVDQNRLNEAELVATLDDYVDQMGRQPDVVFLDYLGYWAQAFRGERYERTSDAIMTLKAVAKDRRIPIITPHQVSRIAKYGEEPEADGSRDSGVVEETADFLFVLWSADSLHGRSEEEKQGVVNLRVGKSRHGGRGVKVALQFAPVSLTLVPHGDPLVSMARDELYYERLRDNWETAVRRHRRELPFGVRAEELRDLIASGLD